MVLFFAILEFFPFTNKKLLNFLFPFFNFSLPQSNGIKLKLDTWIYFFLRQVRVDDE